MPETARVASGM